MARLTVEECWWTDLRRSALIRILGSEDVADVAALRMWRAAQEFWKTDRCLLPKATFELLPGADALIKVGLAEARDEGIYVRGSSAYLEWIHEKRESAKIAGRKSAEARLKKLGSAQPKGGRQDQKIERESNEDRTESNTLGTETDGIEPSCSSSSSRSGSHSEESRITTTTPRKMPEATDVTKAFEIWNETLRTFKIPASSMNVVQQASIGRAIVQLGFDTVCLALEGQRYEKPNDTFKPAEHLSIDRVLHRDPKGFSRWEKFANMARAENQKAATRIQAATAPAFAEDPKDDWSAEDAARSKAKMAEILGSLTKSKSAPVLDFTEAPS